MEKYIYKETCFLFNLMINFFSLQMVVLVQLLISFTKSLFTDWRFGREYKKLAMHESEQVRYRIV